MKFKLFFGIFGLTILLLGLCLCYYQKTQEVIEVVWENVDTASQMKVTEVAGLLDVVEPPNKAAKTAMKAVQEARAVIIETKNTGKRPIDSKRVSVFQRNQKELSSALSWFMAEVDKNPSLKKDLSFNDRKKSLELITDILDSEIRRYNKTVKNLNEKLENRLVNSVFHREEYPFLAVANE